MKHYFDLLGWKVRDKVTGFSGVASSISFELYGCVQILVNPGLDKTGKFGDQAWFDAKRLTKLGKKRVMPPPNFSLPENGGDRLPIPSQKQR